MLNEISSLRHDLQLNDYPQVFNDSAINSKRINHQSKHEKPLGSVYILYVRTVSEKFNCIGNGNNIRNLQN
jgi:hypothetical protein